MRYKTGSFVSLSTSDRGVVEGIIVESRRDLIVLQLLGSTDMNGKMYIKKNKILNIRKLPRSKLFLFLDSNDKSALKEIFSSLQKCK